MGRFTSRENSPESDPERRAAGGRTEACGTRGVGSQCVKPPAIRSGDPAGSRSVEKPGELLHLLIVQCLEHVAFQLAQFRAEPLQRLLVPQAEQNLANGHATAEKHGMTIAERSAAVTTAA